MNIRLENLEKLLSDIIQLLGCLHGLAWVQELMLVWVNW